MDYDAVLAHVLALLQQEQRLSYRVLKLRLQLDDDTLEALKEDLIYAKKLAVDEDGRVLVWTGAISSVPASISPVPLLATSDVSSAQGEVAPLAAPTPDAERRQLTVMFCDLVDSTRLSSQLDPEDYRDVVRAYHTACTEVIRRYDGHIAQLLGDGLLVYFGFPQAHEDDAQRAVRAGLGLVAALEKRQAHPGQRTAIRLAVRIGIHTGLVVVGEMGGGSRQEQLALGETPNVAARIQGLAAPDTVAISPATFRLVRGYFTCQNLGSHPLKGLAAPLQVYRVLGASEAQSRLDVAEATGFTPLVGRASEVALLRERWAQARDGLGQVVLLSGEAGIGKSRLVQVLYERTVAEPHVRLEWRCSPYAQQSALHPVMEYLHRLLRWRPEATPAEKLGTLEAALAASDLALPKMVPLFAALLSLPLPERYPPLIFTPQQQRQKTLDAVLTWLLAEATRQPVLFIVEDLHWIDPSTLEFLTLFLDQVPTARILTLLTCRPEFRPPWGFRAHLTSLTLNRLPRPQVPQMIERIAGGKALPMEVVEQIVAKTDGIPLFVEELTKTVLESGLLEEQENGYVLYGPLPPLAIPATLHDSLMARLDRLATVKDVAQLGATIGRTFAYELLQAVSTLDEAALQQSLRQLVEAELVYQRGVPPQATYTFKHALIQEAAYASLLRRTRQHHHQHIAQVLEAQFPDTTASQPELLARHYTEAGLVEQAMPFWQRAGQQALERSAYVEATSHLTTGLDVLQHLAVTPERHRHELDLHLTLAQALHASKGQASPEIEQAYARARELCQQVNDTPKLFRTLLGLFRFYGGRMQLQTARELTEQMYNLAQRTSDPDLLLEAHMARGTIALLLGELVPAHRHLAQAVASYDIQRHRSHAVRYVMDPGTNSYSRMSWVLWLLGYPDQALRRSQDTLALAQSLTHAHSLTGALYFAGVFHQFRREASAAQALAEATVQLATEQGMAQRMATGEFLRGWALTMQGRSEEGLAHMRQGLADYRATGTVLDLPWYLGVLAEACGRTDRVDEGLAIMAEALAMADDTGYYAAELYRLKGVLLMQHAVSDVVQAEACLQQALTIARCQQAKSLELRAAVSLSCLWQQQGKRDQARELLAPVYGWFTEGFDTADLQEAKALLAELAG